MGDRSFDKLFDDLNTLSPDISPSRELPIPPENILDLTLISSPRDRGEDKKKESGDIFDTQVFLSDDQIFSTKFKEIQIDAKPVNLADSTPASTALEPETPTPRSKPNQQQEPLNYLNFESAAFKDTSRRESLDSIEYLNLALDEPRTQTGRVAPPLSKPKEPEEEKNEFGNFYDNLYYTSLNGPPVVGAFILKNKDSKNEFLYSYPPSLKVNRPGNNDKLKATYSSKSYTCERDHTAELQSSIHLLPELAFGARKRDSLVDFVHFVLPSSSGNVLYGTSYVLQFTENIDNYGSILNLVQQNVRTEGMKKHSAPISASSRFMASSSTSISRSSTASLGSRAAQTSVSRSSSASLHSRSASAGAGRDRWTSSRECVPKTVDLFNLHSTERRPTSRGGSSDRATQLLDLNSSDKKVESHSTHKSSTLKELDFLNFDPPPRPKSTATKKNEFKPFDFFSFDSSPTKSEETLSKKEPSIKGSSTSNVSTPSSAKTKVFSLIDFDEEDKKEDGVEEKKSDEKSKEENVFGMFSDLSLKKSWFGLEDDKENKEENKEKDEKKKLKEVEVDKNKKDDNSSYFKLNLSEIDKSDKSDKPRWNDSIFETRKSDNPSKESHLDLSNKLTLESRSDLSKKLELDSGSDVDSMSDPEIKTNVDRKKVEKPVEEREETTADLGYKTHKELSGSLAKRLGFELSDEEDDNNNKKNQSDLKGIINLLTKTEDTDEEDDEDDKKIKLGRKSENESKFNMGLKSDKEDVLNMGLKSEKEENVYKKKKSFLEAKFDLGKKLVLETKLDIEKKLGLEKESSVNKKTNLDKIAHKSELETKLGIEKKLIGEKGDKGKRSSIDGDGSRSGSSVQVKKPEPEMVKRYYVAICLIYKVPFFGLIGSRLEYVAQSYFDNQNFKDHSLLLSFLEHINKSDRAEDWSYESLFFNIEYHFKPFSLCLSYRALLFLLKSVLAEQRIAIYSECAARTSTCILSMLTMIPCANSLNFNSKAFGSLWFSWKKYGFPLELFRENNPIYPYFTESMVSLLDETTGYLIGITDLKIIKLFKDPPALIFDLEEEAIKLRTKDLLGIYSPSFYEISFFNDFEIFEDLEIDDEPFKMVLDTSENIFNFVGDYLSKAPSAIIHLGGKASKIYHIGRSLGSRRHKESYLRLFDVYFPGALPKFLRFSKRQSKTKKLDPPPENTKPVVDEGEIDTVGKQERVSKYKKKKKVDALEELKAQWDKIMEPEEDEEDKKNDLGLSDEIEGEMDEPAFTFKVMFEKMRRRSMKYRYLGYIPNLQPNEVKDRTKEIEYAIFTRIQPLRDFLLKFLKSSAYAGGKGRKSYQLVMDFTFDLDSMVDFNNPVDGVYVIREGKYLRGCVQDEPDSEDEVENLEDVNRKSYLMEGDEEVLTKVPAMLATFILELHNNYSVDFFELWIQTKNFSEFFKNHNLEVFNEPVFYLSNNLAKYTYPNGDFYVGELSDMLRDGKGSYVSKDGSRYDGTWKRDKRHGKGTLVTNDLKYTGEWINDRKHGFGRLETQAYSYVGDFRLNKYHGNGTMLLKNGIKMKGEFRNGKFEGKGIMNLPDGTVRMGTFKNGVITGVCSVIDREGRVYVGQMYGDNFHGKGVLKYNKQTSFEGLWSKGKREKQGIIINRVAGSVLKIEGVWENDNMLMNEVLVAFPNGYKYNGGLRYFPTTDITLEQLKEDRDFKEMDPKPTDEELLEFLEAFKKVSNRLLPHGHGICKDTSGGVYNGQFFFGSRHGKTSQVFPNGFIYSGEYYLGKYHGKAMLHHETNESIKLNFDKGKLLNEYRFLNTQGVKELLKYETPVFEKDFTRYKLDFLVEVMKSTNLSHPNAPRTSDLKQDKVVDDLIPLN